MLEAFALKNKTAEEVARCLLNLFCRYAAPGSLILKYVQKKGSNVENTWVGLVQKCLKL